MPRGDEKISRTVAFPASGEGNGSAVLKTRAKVTPGDTSDLTPIFADDAAWEAEFADLSGRYAAITALRGTLGRSAADLAAVMAFETSLDRSTERLGRYASLRVSEDSSHAPALDREGRFSSLCAKISEACSWVARRSSRSRMKALRRSSRNLYWPIGRFPCNGSAGSNLTSLATRRSACSRLRCRRSAGVTRPSLN